MKILVARESGGWGDVLCTLFAVRGLRLKYPDAEISYLCTQPIDAFLRGVCDINTVIPFGWSDSSPARRWRIKRRHMNEPLDLERLGFSRQYDLIVDCWCPADVHERATGGRVTRSRIEAFCAAAQVECPPVPQLEIPDADRAWARGMLDELCPSNLEHRALIQLRAANVTKSWPLESTVQLGHLLRDAGIAPVSVKVDGADAPGIPCLMGLSHWKVAALAAEADVVIAPDSALFHLANFTSTPCVALFGPTPGNQYVRHYPGTRILGHGHEARSRVGCQAPCLWFAVNGFPPPSQFCQEEGECMKLIEPGEVLQAVLSVVSRQSSIVGETCNATSV